MEEQLHVGDMGTLERLAGELRDATTEVERLETELADAQRTVKAIAEHQIPEVMERLGLEEFKTASGLRIKISKVVCAHVNVDNRETAYAWLEENGHGGMIKRSVIVGFNKGQDADAESLRADLSKKYPAVGVKLDLNAMTLKAWVTRRLEDGDEIPDAITVEVIKTAKIK
jgi:hypothetical protein